MTGNGDENGPPRWLMLLTSSAFRGALMSIVGIALTVNEAIQHGPERPSLYVLFAGMMGLPLVWGAKK